jgi:hypothetical protein
MVIFWEDLTCQIVRKMPYLLAISHAPNLVLAALLLAMRRRGVEALMRFD